MVSPGVWSGSIAAAMVGVLALASTACGTATPATSPPPAVLQPGSPGSSLDHHCADLFVQSQVQLPAVRGVWDCLEPAVQRTYPQTGDQAVGLSGGYFLGPATFLGCDAEVCVYGMQFEATTAVRVGVSETTLTVWLDSDGLVAFVAIANPVR